MSMLTDTEAATWQPGDPLYRKGSYTSYLFNFRDDPHADDEEYCVCGDAASWPEPKGSQRISDGDELGDFIEAVHANRAEATR